MPNDIYINDVLVNGFDYRRQAWVVDGFYVSCGHPDHIKCACYGRVNAGKPSLATFEDDVQAFANGAPSAPSYVTAQVIMVHTSVRLI